MSRSRNIKPGFFKNDLLAECQPLARLLFAGLWCEADRSGRLLDRPKKIKVDCLPYDDCDCDELLEELRRAGFIARYRISDIGYIQVLSFDKHQNPHKNEALSELPAMPTEDVRYKHSTSTVQEPKMDEAIGLIPDSLLLIPDPIEDQEPLRDSLREPAKKSAKGSRLDSDWMPSESMLAYADKKCPGVDAMAEAENFRDYWIALPGTKGVKLDWEATWRTWVRRAESFAKQRNHHPGTRHANHNLSLADRAAAIHANRGRDDAIDATFTPIDR